MRVRQFSFLVLGLSATTACAESATVQTPRSPPQATVRWVQPPGPTMDDSFWDVQAASDAVRPPPMRPRSISLGFVGDAPLSGGVMRDTPMPPARYAPRDTWNQYIREPNWPSPRPVAPYPQGAPVLTPYGPPAPYAPYGAMPQATPRTCTCPPPELP